MADKPRSPEKEDDIEEDIENYSDDDFADEEAKKSQKSDGKKEPPGKVSQAKVEPNAELTDGKPVAAVEPKDVSANKDAKISKTLKVPERSAEKRNSPRQFTQIQKMKLLWDSRAGDKNQSSAKASPRKEGSAKEDTKKAGLGKDQDHAKKEEETKQPSQTTEVRSNSVAERKSSPAKVVENPLKPSKDEESKTAPVTDVKPSPTSDLKPNDAKPSVAEVKPKPTDAKPSPSEAKSPDASKEPAKEVKPSQIPSKPAEESSPKSAAANPISATLVDNSNDAKPTLAAKVESPKPEEQPQKPDSAKDGGVVKAGDGEGVVKEVNGELAKTDVKQQIEVKADQAKEEEEAKADRTQEAEVQKEGAKSSKSREEEKKASQTTDTQENKAKEEAKPVEKVEAQNENHSKILDETKNDKDEEKKQPSPTTEVKPNPAADPKLSPAKAAEKPVESKKDEGLKKQDDIKAAPVTEVKPSPTSDPKPSVAEVKPKPTDSKPSPSEAKPTDAIKESAKEVKPNPGPSKPSADKSPKETSAVAKPSPHQNDTKQAIKPGEQSKLIGPEASQPQKNIPAKPEPVQINTTSKQPNQPSQSRPTIQPGSQSGASKSTDPKPIVKPTQAQPKYFLIVDKNPKNRFSQWLNLYKLNCKRLIPYPNPVEGPIKHFVLTLHTASGIPKPTMDQETQVHIQHFVSLFDPTLRQFIGGTYASPTHELDQKMAQKQPKDQWCFFHTKLTGQLQVIVESVLVITHKKKATRRVGVGFATLPVFGAVGQHLKKEFCAGSPRQLLCGSEAVKAPSTLDYSVAIEHQFAGSERAIPSECIIGPGQIIPGVLFQTQELPQDLALITKASFAARKCIFMHELNLQGLAPLEEGFRGYLRKLCESEKRLDSKGLASSTRSSVIQERRLNIVAHNTWGTLGPAASLIIQKHGSQSAPQFTINGPLKLQSYLPQPHVLLLCSVTYKVQFRSQNGDLTDQEFTLGWTVISPEVHPNGTDIVDSKVQVKLQTGPGTTLTGEMLWDMKRAMGLDGTKTKPITLSGFLSSSANYVDPEKRKRIQEQTEREAKARLDEMRGQIKAEMFPGRESLTEEQRQQVERELIERQNSQCKLEDKESIEKIKTYYLSKNISVEEMIKHVMGVKADSAKDAKTAQHLLQQNPEKLDNLLKFLVNIVMRKSELSDQELERLVLQQTEEFKLSFEQAEREQAQREMAAKAQSAETVKDEPQVKEEVKEDKPEDQPEDGQKQGDDQDKGEVKDEAKMDVPEEAKRSVEESKESEEKRAKDAAEQAQKQAERDLLAQERLEQAMAAKREEVLRKIRDDQAQEEQLYEHTKKSLLDLLKTDENLLKSIFGKTKQPSETDDRINALREEAKKHLPDLQMQDPVIDMEIEYNDILKASLCCFKFIALRTFTAVPASLFFTFNFYNFQEATTEVVYLKTAQQIEAGNLTLDLETVEPHKQYLLVYKDLLKMLDPETPALEQIMERAIKQQFDINPVATRNHEEHLTFAQYLETRTLKLEVWNAKTKQHVGTCTVPLKRLLRQGDASREVALELDMVDFDTKQALGALSILMTNEGRRINKHDMPQRPVHRQREEDSPAKEMMPASAPSVLPQGLKTKKKVYSKPLEVKTCPNTEVDSSELERKQRRIARMRLQTAGKGNCDLDRNQEDGDHSKEMMLLQIQKMREAKKQTMMSLINR